MILIKLLAIVLVGWTSRSGDLTSPGLGALCSQPNACATRTSEWVKAAVNACNLEVKALDCDGLAAKDPDMKPMLRHCDFKSQCEQEEAYQKDKEVACLRGYRNSLVDTGVAIKDMAVSLGKFVDDTWENFKNNIKLKNDFIRQCEKSISCKRDLVAGDQRYNQMSDEKLAKFSAAFLYVQAQDMAAWKASLARAPGRMGRRPEAGDEVDLTVVQRDRLADLMGMAGSRIREQYNKFSCYSSVAKVEMACYAIGNVIDPTLLAGAAFKGVRVAKAARGFAKAEEVARVGEESSLLTKLRSAAINRQNLVREYLNFSPTTVAQNEKWIAVAEQGASSKVRFLDVENSQLKTLNDTLKDKNLVTSLTNLHKDLLFQKIEALKKDFPNLKIEEYSDFKSSRFAFSGDVPKDLDKRLQQIFKDTNDEFSNFMKSQQIVREEDAAKDWFRAGTGQSAEQANAAARYSRQVSTNTVQNFAADTINSSLTNKLNNIEKSRQVLRSSLSKTSMVDGSTFHADVFDIVRKNMGDNQAITRALAQRFAVKDIAPATVRDLQTYVKTSDEFSPGLFVPKREVANLSEAAQGGFSADVIGLGAANMKGTSEALARSKNLEQALVETRKGEKAVTEAFQAQKKYFEEVVQRSVDPGKIKTVCSGDDCIAVAVKPLTEADKKKILSGLADSKYSGKFRLAFIPEGVKDATARNILSTHGESVEKLLRASLGSVMEPRRLQGLTFGLDMRTQTLNNGSIKLLIGEAPGVRLSTQERSLIEKNFAESLKEFNAEFASKGVKSAYQPAR